MTRDAHTDEAFNAQKTAEINKQIKLAMQILDDLAKYDRKPQDGSPAASSSIKIIKQSDVEPRGSLVNSNSLYDRRQSRRLSISNFNSKTTTTTALKSISTNVDSNRKASGNSSDDLHAIVKKYETWHSNWCKMFNNLF